MTSIGIRELRQDASEIIRRVEGGEEIDITVAGRPAARLVPIARRSWQRWDDVSDLLRPSVDPDWQRDRALIDQAVRDPWEHVG